MVFAVGKITERRASASPILVLIASNLTKSDFAIYAWLVAFTEFTINVSRFGINHLVLRYAPGAARRASSEGAGAASWCCRRCSRVVVMTALRGSSTTWASHGILALLDKADWLPAFELYIAVIIPFGLMVFLRDTVFQSLLQPGPLPRATRRSAMASFCWALPAFLLLADRSSPSCEVIYVDIVATGIAALIGGHPGLAHRCEASAPGSGGRLKTIGRGAGLGSP